MAVPTDLLYTEEHEWARFAEDDVCVVGITQFAQEQLGAIVYVEPPEEGYEVSRGDPVGVVESTKTSSELYAPLSGTIIEINRALDGAEEFINTDPYEEGWIFKMKLEDPGEKDDLMRPEEYQDHVGEDD